MQEYCYRKEYESTPYGGVELKNPELAHEYIEYKIGLLRDTLSKDEQHQVKLSILKEFMEIYEYDCRTAIRPEPFGTFENAREKKEFIRLKQLVESFGLYLGNIFTNYHQSMIEQKYPIPILECDTLVIDYNELYLRAVNEYVGTLLGYRYPVTIGKLGHSNTKFLHACGTTYILPVLIEHFLLMYLQNRMLFKGLEDIKCLCNDELVLLDIDEKKIITTFNEARVAGSGLMNGKQEQVMRKVYQIFVKYKVLEENQDHEQILVGKSRRGSTTLGSIFYSDFARKEIRSEYYELLLILFDTKKLNIRNCIMHGNSVTYDYLAIGIASVMLQVLWDIASEDVFVTRMKSSSSLN